MNCPQCHFDCPPEFDVSDPKGLAALASELGLETVVAEILESS